MSEINYQEAYEREHEKCADLADKIVVLESEKEDLQFKLDRIKKNKFWKATGPARSLIHLHRDRGIACPIAVDRRISCVRSATRPARRV